MSGMTRAMNRITKVYSAIREIYDDCDLAKSGLSYTDYHEAKRVMSLVGAPGNVAETIYGNVAAFFEKYGFTVTPKGIGYEITP